MKEIRSSVILLYNEEGKFLLQHRTKDAPTHPDAWGIFGGAINDEETPLQGVKREAFEELNYKLKKPKLVLTQKYIEKQVPRKDTAHIFVEKFSPDQNLKQKEGDYMKWFHVKDLGKIKFDPIFAKMIKKVAKKSPLK